MSFSVDVKKELGNEIAHAFHCRIAELASIISFSGELKATENGQKLIIRTDYDFVESRVRKLFRFVFFDKIKNDEKSFESFNEKIITINRSNLRNVKSVYKIEIEDSELISSMFKTLKLTNCGDSLRVDNIVIERKCCKRAFLKGAFLAGGSITDPEKSYHLEYIVDSEEKAEQLISVIAAFDVEAKWVLRKKQYVVYVKDGTAIIDLLNVMGAYVALMNMENVRIVKDIRNSVNRQVNCDLANMNKTANAAVKQIEDIKTIESLAGLDSLPAGLREIALLRMEEPELPLRDLGDRLNPPIGKSGVNHRLRKISDIAEKLRNESV